MGAITVQECAELEAASAVLDGREGSGFSIYGRAEPVGAAVSGRTG
jgi:hypothetical protein